MKTIDVSVNGKNVYTAAHNEIFIGKIEYPKWYAMNKAIITLGEDTVFNLEPRGFWHSTQQLLKGNAVLLNVKNTWKGYLLTKPIDPERPYKFQHQGLFKNGYVLLNYKDEVVLKIAPNFSWKKFNMSYTITCDDIFGNEEFDQLLLLLSVHYLRIIQSSASGSA